jgi:beta-lactamase class A
MILSHRADERFAMCSTFKWTLAAAIFRAVEEGRLDLKRDVAFDAAELLDYSPVTRAHQGPMTIEALAEAAVVASDNTAANLLLACIGGPPGLSQFFRSLGDSVTRLDRREPELNTNLPGDIRDTTSPGAMVQLLRVLLTTEALTPLHRERLVAWMVESRTGAQRLRAGLPLDWRVGDKTGTGDNGAANDVAIAWPPGRGPVLIAVYMSHGQASWAALNAAHAEIGRLVAACAT